MADEPDDINAPLLSPEESEALRHEFGEAGPESVDLVAGERNFRRAVSRIETRRQAFSDAVTTQASFALGVSSLRSEAQAAVIGPREGADAMRDMALAASLLQGQEVLAHLGLDVRLAFGLVERAFGGQLDETGSLPPFGRPGLTLIEEELVTPFLFEVAETLHRVFAASHTTTERLFLARPMGNAKVLDLPPSRDGYMLWTIDLHAGSLSFRVSLLATPEFLKRCLGDDYSEAPIELRRDLMAHLAQVPLLVTGVLGRVTLSVGDFLAMQSGAILKLDATQNQPSLVQVGGVNRFLAKPIQKDGMLAMEIIGEVTT